MRAYSIFLLVLTGVFIIDLNLKSLFVSGYYREGACIDLVLRYNRGVAFSMLSFLGPYLKWIQGLLVVVVIGYSFREGYVRRYAFPIGLLVGGALSNLYDRFYYDAVVDYVAWHCGFNYAVFNFSDVMIDIGIAWILLALYRASRNTAKP